MTPIAIPRFRFLCLLLVTACLCWPVSAQSQSPTSPVPQPRGASGVLGDMPNQQQYQQDYQGGGTATGRRQGSSLFNRDARSGGLMGDSVTGQSGVGLGSSTGTGAAVGGTGESGARRDRAGRRAEGEGQPPTEQRGEEVGLAATDTGAGRDSASSGTSGGGPVSVGGGGGGAAGGGTTFTKGTPGTVSVAGGGGGSFEPLLEREVEYGDVPDEGEPITLEGPMTLGEFLAAINLATNWNIIIAPEIQDVNLRFWISETTPKAALEILKFYKVFYEWDTELKCLRVMTEEDHLKRQFGRSKPHEFRVKEVDIAFAESMVTSLLSGSGRSITDQRTGIIYVWDTEDNIREMTRIMADIDVPLKSAEFRVQHADIPDIESVLSNLMTQSGTLLSDVRTGQLFVWDTPAVLDQMRLAVERLDQPVLAKTFELKYVNAADITDIIEGLLTERGTIQVDPRFNTLVVTDLPARIDRIAESIAVLDRELETRTWVIRYADIDFVADQIETYIPGDMGNIVVNDLVHQITVTGLPSRLDEIDKLIKVWDIKRRQVLIEAFIVEVSDEVERAFNVNWSYFGSASGSPISVLGGQGFKPSLAAKGSGETMQVGQLPYAIPSYGALQLDGDGKITRPLLTDVLGNQIIDRYAGNKLALALDYLDKQNKATILSSPRVTVQDGEEAMFENATRVPYVSASTYYGGYGGYGGSVGGVNDNFNRYSGVNNTNRVEFIDVGTILTVYPVITEDDNILLDISAEDSTFIDKEITVNDQKSSVPEKTARRADTQVRVNSGDTVVLGGLRRDKSRHASTKTPFLGDLPLVGGLFRNPSRSSQNNSLLIFITTTIVDDKTSPEAEQLARAEEEVAGASRYNKKDFWGRLQHRATGGAEEINVSVGQSGTIYSATKKMTLAELRDSFEKAAAGVTVVVRKHPAAPVETVNAVVDAAREAGLKVDHDKGLPPIVPRLRDPEPAAGLLEIPADPAG